MTGHSVTELPLSNSGSYAASQTSLVAGERVGCLEMVKVLHQSSMQSDTLVALRNLCAFFFVAEMRIVLGQTVVKTQCWLKRVLLTFLFLFSPRDKGMKHMVGKNWRDLFDMVIVQADKPNFFTDRRKYVS